MLQDFLEKYRKEILLLTAKKTRNLAGSRDTSNLLDEGLSIFFEQLILALQEIIESQPSGDMLKSAATHGAEFLRLGYTLSHVVHSYGAMCQAITELATMKDAKISSSDFNILNGCLDVAIASAVSEYEYKSNLESEAREVKHLGFLAHELRNALASATIAHEMIKSGFVGTGGSTSIVLETSLSRMRNLIDRSLSEVRMRSDADLYLETFKLSSLFDQIAITARVDAKKKKQTLDVDVPWALELTTDRQFLLSAVANLVQNAIKYTNYGQNILLKGRVEKGRVLISIEDGCGGIPAEKIATLFQDYSKSGKDRSGLGLGLGITRKAIERCQGSISIENNKDIGCVFSIDIPEILIPPPVLKKSVPGVESVQPNLNKRDRKK